MVKIIQELQSLKYSIQSAGAWASANALNTARAGGAAFGIQTAAIFAAGNLPAARNVCESYNGTTWITVNNVNDGV